MEETSNKVQPSLPANYVTLVDLRERWMQKHKQKQRDEEILGNDCKVEEKRVGDGNELDQKYNVADKSPVQSNPNPRPSTRWISHGNRRRIGSISQPNHPTGLQLNQQKQAPVAQGKQFNPPSPALVRLVKAKEAPAIRVIQSKFPPLDPPNVESCGENRITDKMVEEKKRRWEKEINDEKKDVVQLKPENCVKENPELGFDYKTGAEIERCVAGTGKRSGCKSVTVTNLLPFKKENEGGYHNFDRRFMLNKGRPRIENSCKVEEERVGDGNELDQKHQALENLLPCSNPNPKPATGWISHGNRRPIESRNQLNPPTGLPLNQQNQALVVQAKKLNPPQPAQVRILEVKKAPAIRVIQSKRPPLDSRIHWNRKRNDEKEKCAEENPKLRLDNKTGAEIERRVACLSLSSGTGEKSGSKSIIVRNFCPFTKENEGGYHKFDRRFKANRNRSRFENGLVWVKKGEASLTNAVQVE